MNRLQPRYRIHDSTLAMTDARLLAKKIVALGAVGSTIEQAGSGRSAPIAYRGK